MEINLEINLKVNPAITPEISQIPSGDLAYLGDAVIELLVRERLVKSGHSGAGRLNRMAAEYVTAVKQAEAVDRITHLFTEDESDVFRRARNQTKSAVPRSATAAEYRKATALEALFAYLMLKGDTQRMYELFDAAYPQDNNENNENNENNNG